MLSVSESSTVHNHTYDQPVPVLLRESPELANTYFDLRAIQTEPLKDITFTLHVGGSAAYNAGTARDFDGLIIMETYHDILRVLKDPPSLAMLLRIQPEGGSDMLAQIATQCLDGTVHKFFEAVRFAGTTLTGQKKSVKLVSRECLRALACSTEHHCVATLSCKEKREYETPGGRVRIQDVSVHPTLPVFVLHDADLYMQRSIPHTDSEVALPAFGCLVDLFMTSRAVFYHQTEDVQAVALDLLDIQHRLFSKFTVLSGITKVVDPSSVFARSARFSQEYRKQLNEKFKIVCLAPPSDWDQERLPLPSSPSQITLLWPPANVVHLQKRHVEEAWKLLQLLEPRAKLPEKDLFLLPPSYPDVDSIEPAGFSQNSTHGVLSTPLGPVFWKTTTSWQSEVSGSHMLYPFYPRSCHKPIMVDLSIIRPRVFYPFIEGSTLSSIRARFLSSHQAHAVLNSNDISCIIAASATRADDVLSGWIKSLSICLRSTSAVDQFFTERLNNNSRMRLFYGSGLVWGNGFSLTLHGLLQVPITINDVKYPPLEVSLRCAEKILQDHRDNEHIQIVGHGDLHGGNIIIPPPSTADHTANPRIRYVDYEAAGFHSPWLDVAKPLYNDTFFYYLYADILGMNLFESGEVQATLDGNGLHIVFSPGRRDPIAGATFQILVEGLLKPFEASIAALHPEWAPFSGSQVLAQALLACAILTRNVASRPDIFFGNLAIGMILANSEPRQLLDVISGLL